MKVQMGNFEFKHNKKDRDMSAQESKISAMPKIDTEKLETSTDDGKFVKGATIIIKTYFIWKMADRVVEKILR